MKKFLIVGATVLAFSTTAFAGSCPTLVHKVDEALKTAQLSDADKATVMSLRDQGDQQHAAGQHAESVATLTEALKALGM